MKVWLLDPASMTHYYDISLTAALRENDVDVRLLTSRFLYEDHTPRADQYADYFFFKPLMPFKRTLRRQAWLRRMARLTVYPFDLLRLWRYFQQDPPDILHVQWTLLPGIDYALMKRMAQQIPLILTVHNPMPHTAAFAAITDMRPYYDLATHFIVHAEENRQILQQIIAPSARKISTVPMGAMLEGGPAPSREEARAKLGLPADAQVVLFQGSIKPYKGVFDLIAAMALVRAQFPNAHLLLVGKPEGGAEPYEAAIIEHGIQDATSAYFTFVPAQDIPFYFAACDVYCLPYHDASQSAALLTAYRFGRPVIVTEVGGLPETVENGQNGLVVPPRDPAALAEAIAMLFADRDLRERFGKRSAELAETRYSWQRAAELTREVYDEVLNDNKAND